MQQSNINHNVIKPSWIAKRLTQRFCYDKIINEEYYIKNMSPKMLINIQKILKDQVFKNCSRETSIQAISLVPFFKLQSNKKYVKIQYENANKILIVTGIKREFIKEWTQQWNSNKRNYIIKEINLGYWHFIELNIEQSAFGLKKFMRLKKGEMDFIQNERKLSKKQKNNQGSYKFSNRRVRIALLNQDVFTILFDMINQTNYQKFCQAIEGKNQYHLYKNLSYLPLSKEQKYEQRIEQIDDGGSSQFLSHTSSAYDQIANRISQIDVQTSNQGTQMSGIGVGADFQEQCLQQKVITPKKHQNKQQTQESVEKAIKSQKTQVQQRQKLINEQQTKKEYDNQKKQSAKSTKNINIEQKQKQSHNNNKNKKQQNFHTQPRLKLRKTLTSQQFPSLQIKKFSSKSSQLVEQQTPLLHLQYNEMKRKYNQFIKQSQGLIPQPDIPEYIRRQSQYVMYRKKFYLELVRKAKKIVINRTTSLD